MKYSSLSKSQKIALFGALCALAFIFSFVEFLLPISIGIPGAKLGLANLVTVIALYKLSPKEAIGVSIVRVILSAFVFTNMYSLAYSLFGAALSLCSMILLHKTKRFSPVGVSAVGGAMHNMGQLLAATLFFRTGGLFFLVPVLLTVGVLTGALLGIVAKIVIDKTDNITTGFQIKAKSGELENDNEE